MLAGQGRRWYFNCVMPTVQVYVEGTPADRRPFPSSVIRADTALFNIVPSGCPMNSWSEDFSKMAGQGHAGREVGLPDEERERVQQEERWM